MRSNEAEVYEEISIKELLLVIYDNRRLIFAILLITMLLTIAGTYYMNQNSKEAKILISINHTKISEGKNPDGSTFDPYEIVSPYVLKDVIKALDIERTVSINDIRKSVTIEPLVPERIKTKQEFLLEKEGEMLSYNPNEFIISVSTSDKIGDSLARKVANEIVDSYTDYFTEEYIKLRFVTNRLIGFEVNNYDYSDISKVLHKQLNDLVRYNKSHYQMDQDFRSKETGLTFNEISNAVDIIDEVDLNRIDSLISSYKLTKDKAKLRVYYEYMIEKLTLQKDKLNKSTGVSREMLDKVDNNNMALLETLNGEMKDSKDSYFSQLILKSASLGSSSADIEKSINFYQAELEELISEQDVLKTNQNEAKEIVTNSLDNITYNLQNWIELTNRTSSEFYNKLMTKAVRPLSPAEIYSSVNIKLNLAIGLVLGLMMGIFATFLKAALIEEN